MKSRKHKTVALVARRKQHALLGMVLAFAMLHVPGALAAEIQDIPPRAREQILLLQMEKAGRTPAQRKMDSRLCHALRQKKSGVVAPGLEALKTGLRLEADDRLLVDLRADVKPALLRFIERNGGEVLYSDARYDAVRARVPLESIEALAARAEVHSLRPADEAITNTGPINSGGDIAHRAAQARSAFGATGSGVKIGVLSDSVLHLADSQAAGELPTTVHVLPGQAGAGGSGEGTAMLEIIHDLAPGSELYFATAFNGVASFAQNILALQAAGCRIIVDDVTYVTESPLQDGPISQAVNAVSAAGTLFFSSAGNGGSKLKGTSGTWEGDFRDGGLATTNAGSGRLHDFGGGLTFNTVLPGGGFTHLDLFWADPLGHSTNDYDVYILDETGDVVRSSNNIQNGNEDPYESIPLSVGERIVIVKNSGAADRFLSLMTLRGVLSISTSGSVRGHNACGAANAFSVAACRAATNAIPFDTSTTNQVEWFSSDGYRRIFFEPNGNAITPGNFSATGGRVLAKPDITAADGVATSVPGFSTFFGTSAAAPHAAALAALLWSQSPSLPPSYVRTFLTFTALDIEQPGADRNAGAGIVMADHLLEPGPIVLIDSVQLADGNGGGSMNANECAELTIVLKSVPQPSSLVLTGLTAVLTTSSGAVTVDPLPREFPDLPPGGSAAATSTFRFSTAPLFDCGTNVNFTLQLSSSNQITFNIPFVIAASVPGVGTPVIFESTAVPQPIPDLDTIESELAVTNLPLPLERLRVAVHLTHTFDDDLRLTLISPQGVEVLLSEHNGGDGLGYGTSCSSRTVFSDDAAVDITAGLAPFAGTFRPQQGLSVFRRAAGAAVAGTWRLRVEDLAGVDVGTLLCWSLELSPPACGDGGGGACLLAAPTIVQEPADQSVTNGGTIQFSVQAEGTAPLAYHWFFNGTNALPALTNATIVLTNVSPADTGTYSVRVSNLYGERLSRSALLSFPDAPVLLCGTNHDVAWDAAWDFDPPTALGNGVTVTIVSTTTTPGCGNSYIATRTWLATDTNGLQDTCSQTVSVLDTRAPILTCAPDKVIIEGNPWSFDAPLSRAAGALESTVYSNTLADLGLRFNPGTNEAGDEISLDGTAAHLARFAFQYWGSGPEEGPFEGDVRARVRFYRNDGPPLPSGRASPGTVLFDSGAFPISATARATRTLEEFQVDAQVPLTSQLPGAFTWTVQFSGLGPNDAAGLELYSPPVIGGNDTNYWERVDTEWLLQTDPLTPMDFAAQFVALSRGTTVSVLSTVTNVLSAYASTVTRTWRSLDDCDNAATCSQTVTLTVVEAPGIAEEPHDETLVLGQDVLLTALATGTPTLGYQWFFNVTNVLAGATLPSLALSNVQPADAGSYSLVVSNAYGAVTSAPAILTVLFAPIITEDPQDQTVDRGQNVLFTGAAIGTPPLGYQWFFNMTNVLAGATLPSLTLNNVQPADAGSYSLVASNAFGAATSAPAILVVQFAPAITADPQDQTVDRGQDVLFNAAAIGTPTPGYQWFFNMTNVLAGATLPSLNLSSVQPADAGAYSFVASNAFGAATSAPAILVVRFAPVITQPPASLAVEEGQDARFTVAALGTPPLGYQWLFNGSPVTGATTSALNLVNVQTNDAGDYSSIVSNMLGSVTSHVAILFLRVPTLICGTNRDVMLEAAWDFDPPTALGNGVTVTIVSTTTTPGCGNSYTATRDWLATGTNGLHDTCSQTVSVLDTRPPTLSCAPDKVIIEGNPWSFDTPLSRAAGALESTVYSNTLADLGLRFNPGTNEAGDEISLDGTAAHLGRFAFQYWGSGPEGGDFEGDVRARVRFYRNDGPPLPSGRASPGTVLFDSGAFPISATARATRTLEEFQVDAQVPLTSQLPGAFTWTVQFSGLGSNDAAGLELYSPPVIGGNDTNYWERVDTEWLLQTDPLTPMDFAAQFVALSRGTTVSVLSTVTNVLSAYASTVTRTWRSLDDCDNAATCSQTVTLLTALSPFITEDPQHQDVVRGSNVVLSATALGATPLQYQWFFDETNALPGATLSSLELTDVQTSDAGSYWVVVSNAFGAVTSAPAILIVRFAPIITEDPLDQTVGRGQDVLLTALANGTPTLGYQWFFNITNVLAGATLPSLALPNVQPADAGSYSLVVSNALGAVTSAPAFLVVQFAPAITGSPQDQTVARGQNVLFTGVAIGTPPLGYQWFFNLSNVLAGATLPSLILPNVQPADSGAYTLVVSNALGTATSAPAILAVEFAPIISQQPTTVAAPEGGSAQFTVGVNGTPPLYFQWYRDCTNPIVGANSDSLAFPNVALAQGGTYCVLVSNLLGSEVSAPATLRVLIPPDVFHVTHSGTVATVTFSTRTGQTYSVQFKEIFTSPDWLFLRKGSNLPGTGYEIILLDPLATGPQRFYRILTQ